MSQTTRNEKLHLIHPNVRVGIGLRPRQLMPQLRRLLMLCVDERRINILMVLRWYSRRIRFVP
jgi:hypothetical protein